MSDQQILTGLGTVHPAVACTLIVCLTAVLVTLIRRWS